MTIPTLSTLPTAPARTDAPATFVTRADAFLAALVTFQSEMNTSIAAMNTDIASVNANVTLASEWAVKNDAAVSGSNWSAFANASGAAPTGSAKAWATTAEDTIVADGEYSGKHYSAKSSASATAAASSAATAALTANAALWVSGASYAAGANAISGVDFQTYRANTATSGTTDPSSSSDWDALVMVNGTLSRQNYTATGGQTTFNINYDVGFVDVYLNGVKLVVGTDFTATSGTNIVLASGATAGDKVDILAFGSFAVADAMSVADADLKYLQKTNNLSDVSSASTALTNLGGASTANNLSDLASASTARANLGLGTIATAATGDYAATANNLSDLASAATSRTNLGVEIDADVLGYVAPSTSGNVLTSDGTNWTSAAAAGGGECQVWCYCTMSGSTVTLQNDTGVTSITDDGAGLFIVNLSVTRTSQYYATSGSAWGTGVTASTRPHTSATTKIWVYFYNTSGSLVDPSFSWSMMSAGAN